jgi:two-component system, chemotaxis family, CheB/CheR fusion protein
MFEHASRTRAEHGSSRVGPPCWVVAICTSAAGIESFTRFLAEVPAQTGMCFVLVGSSQGTEVVQRLRSVTSLPVEEAKAAAPLAADHLHVIPSGVPLGISQGVFAPRTPSAGGHRMPIDAFLRSAADECGSRVMAVILSGDGSDGALGVEAVKGAGGIAFAEDPSSAAHDAMSRAALATGSIDFVLPAADIARKICLMAAELETEQVRAGAPLLDESEDRMKRIFAALWAAHRVDFTPYDRTAIRRRVSRRMVYANIRALDEYVSFLERRPEEIDELHRDLLGHVTHFFRDAEVFDVLKSTVVPALLAGRGGEPVRVWVPGCATGEETYSLAIALFEVLGETGASPTIQIFATDVNPNALEKARAGIYIENIALDVSPERLRRFFVETDGHYQITKVVRDACVFARQDLVRDPPFSRLDLISCRDVLMRLEPALHDTLIPMFHYALRPGGYLVLGGTEGIGDFSDLFSASDEENRIYQKVVGSGRLPVVPADVPSAPRSERKPRRLTDPSRAGELQRQAGQVIARYLPPGVVIDDDLQVVEFRGQTSLYLEPASGPASLDVLKMARQGLMLELRAVILRAKRTSSPARSGAVRVRGESGYRDVEVEVVPLREEDEVSRPVRGFLVLFHDAAARRGIAKKGARSSERETKAQLRQADKKEREVAETKRSLQSMIVELEASNENLEAANHEILLSNEELQIVNEELEAAKEELQSANEELATVNEELEMRNAELADVNDDLVNLITSADLSILMLSRDHCIRRFTQSARRLMNLRPADVGRPVSDLNLGFDAADLDELVREVIATATIRERTVQDRSGAWYSLRIRPYRTLENNIDGAVLCFVDIDAIKKGASPGGGSSP